MNAITQITGIAVGHSSDRNENTGCTVILCPAGATAGVDIRGAAPGTRETELLRPAFLVQKIQAVMLSGGSAFGLRTADGAMRFLAENKIGFPVGEFVVPIVPTAVIFDLSKGRDIRIPTEKMGYEACANAGIQFEEGRVGAGCGATVGKIIGVENAMYGGVASCCCELPRGVLVGALTVVNAFGDIIDPRSGQIIAGALNPDSGEFLDTFRYMKKNPSLEPFSTNNTTLSVVATNAALNKEQATRLAMMAQNGIGRTTRPAHTMYDGDVVFALSHGRKSADINLLGEAAAEMVSESILKAVRISNSGSGLKTS